MAFAGLKKQINKANQVSGAGAGVRHLQYRGDLFIVLIGRAFSNSLILLRVSV